MDGTEHFQTIKRFIPSYSAQIICDNEELSTQYVNLTELRAYLISLAICVVSWR